MLNEAILCAIVISSYYFSQIIFIAPESSTEITTEFKIFADGEFSTHQANLTFVPTEFPIEWMTELPPLRKIHYSWRLPDELINNKPLLYEYARLTHACSITAQWADQNTMNACVEVCKQVNSTTPIIPATVALNYSPYHFVYEKGDPPIGLEDKYQTELDRANTRFTLMNDWLSQANATYNSNIKIGAILLDSELFRYKPDTDPEASTWNAAITEKYQAIETIVKTHFPGTRIEWYGRGQWHPCDTDWCFNTHMPIDFSSPGDSANTALYRMGDFRLMREQFTRAVEYAKPYGVTAVNPWIALGSGYMEWDIETNTPEPKWSNNWNYELINSWKMGGRIDNPWYGNRPERFGPWNACKVVMFYPEPFGRTHDWGRHFVAYVRGAHNIKELP